MLERLEQLEKAATDCWTPVRDRASAEKSVNASQMILMAAPALLAVALAAEDYIDKHQLPGDQDTHNEFCAMFEALAQLKKANDG